MMCGWWYERIFVTDEFVDLVNINRHTFQLNSLGHLGILSAPWPSNVATLNQKENSGPCSSSFRSLVIIARDIVTKHKYR